MTIRDYTILMVDDDLEDCAMVADAFRERWMPMVKLQFVHSGEAVTDYLSGKAPFADISEHPRPQLILLDLNMPGKDGYRVLSELKTTVSYQKIPVVVFSTSGAREDISKAYQLGATSYLVKPDNYPELVKMMRQMSNYWFNTVALP